MNICLLPSITRKKGGITSGENTGRNTSSIPVILIQKPRLSIRRDFRAVRLMLTGTGVHDHFLFAPWEHRKENHEQSFPVLSSLIRDLKVGRVPAKE